jgi:Tat protein secretion system quality control protein TatD with DNase activity
MFYDTHAHFEGTPLETAAVMERALAAGVTRVVAVGGSAALNAGALAAAEAYPANMRLALGFDRDHAASAEPEVFVETLRRLADGIPHLSKCGMGRGNSLPHLARCGGGGEADAHGSGDRAPELQDCVTAVASPLCRRRGTDGSGDRAPELQGGAGCLVLAAVGETGLDFHYHPETAEAQAVLFAAQLRLADEWRLPVIIHTREADEATLRTLDGTPWRGTGLRGVVHCFTGGRVFAEQLLDRALAISFSGIVTFRNAEALREVAAYVPEERLLIETDSPFLAPVPKRGQRNEPAFVAHVAECLATVRGTTVGRIAEVTWANAAGLFG